MTTPPSRPAARPVSRARASILVVHGPNLNLLGSREPDHYGMATLDEIDRTLVRLGEAAGAGVACFQHNHEGALVDRIHQAADDRVDFILINPAAYTHTSVAIRDALAAAAIPFVEVHLSNIHARESFRHHSYCSALAVGVVSGLGAHGYELALQYALRRLAGSQAPE